MGFSKHALVLATITLLAQAQQPANNPGNCPVDNGKYRTDTKGNTYKINCDHAADVTVLSRGARPYFGVCIDVCGVTPGCKGVDYTPETKSCVFLSTGQRGTRAVVGTHNAFLEDDPSKVVPPGPSSNPAPPGPSSGGTGSGSSAAAGPSSGTGSSPSSGTGSGAPNPSSGTTPPISSPPANPPSGGPGPGPTDPNIRITTNPSCPNTDGQAYKTDDGTYYKLQCGYHAQGNTLATYEGVPTWADCMTKCSQTNGCISVHYIAPPGSPGYTNYQCVLADGEGPGATTCAHWFAYTIDPPATEEDKPFPHTLCETSCPISDGLVYESEGGENFRMSCGKRHGTKILWTSTQETFQDCMDSCGKIVPCHSVDYQARTKKCYYGQHHGEPSVPAPGFSSATSVGCGGACKKGCCGGGKGKDEL